MLHALEAFTGRKLSTLFGRLYRGRRMSLPRGGVDEDTLRRARASWWGKDPRWYKEPAWATQPGHPAGGR